MMDTRDVDVLFAEILFVDLPELVLDLPLLRVFDDDEATS